MKKIVFTLTLLVGFATVSFAQEANEIAVSEGSEELAKSKVDGDYILVLSGKTEADISGSAAYYTQYFKVNFDESSQKAKIEMVENNARSRSVIVRFLVASGVRYVDVDGKSISINDFMMNHLQ